MRVLTHNGDQAALLFVFPPGGTHLGRQAARKVAEDARKALVAQLKVDAPDVSGWVRDEFAPFAHAIGEAPDARVEVTVEKLADDAGRDRLEAILQDFAVAISGAIGRPCEVEWK